MADRAVGPPPGFDDVGSTEPPVAMPPTPAFGGTEKPESDKDPKSGEGSGDPGRMSSDKDVKGVDDGRHEEAPVSESGPVGKALPRRGMTDRCLNVITVLQLREQAAMTLGSLGGAPRRRPPRVTTVGGKDPNVAVATGAATAATGAAAIVMTIEDTTREDITTLPGQMVETAGNEDPIPGDTVTELPGQMDETTTIADTIWEYINPRSGQTDGTRAPSYENMETSLDGMKAELFTVGATATRRDQTLGGRIAEPMMMDHRPAGVAGTATETKLRRRKKASDMGVKVPDKVTKVNLLRLVRSTVSSTGDTIMTIGRWKGSLFRDTPDSYGSWAVEQQNTKSSKAKIYDEDSEEEGSKGTQRAATSSRGSWDEVSLTPTKGYTGKGNTKATPKRPSKDLIGKDEKIMDSQPDQNVLEEIQALETKLAVLKDKAREIGKFAVVALYVNKTALQRAYDNKHHEHYDYGAPRDGARGQRQLRYGDPTFDWADTSYENCQRLLESTLVGNAVNPLRPIQHTREGSREQVYETTIAVVRFLNEFGKKHFGEKATWTSISELSTYHTVTFGQRGGGDLWLEEDIDEDTANNNGLVWRKDRPGNWVPGRYHSTKEKPMSFDPFLRHSTGAWDGDRWCLTYHTVRGIKEAGGEIKKFLRGCGFPLPKAPRESRGPRPKPAKSERKNIMNGAGKLSVLMATFLAAAGTFLNEVQDPVPEYDPIVMMEIGGYEGTIEATELNKAVIEPILWPDYEQPDVQENAYHFVKGASPKELRVHLELVRDQLNEGGDVVLRGGDLQTWASEHVDFIKYKSDGDSDGWLVLGRPKKDSVTLQGSKRPYDVCMVGPEEAKQEETKYDGSGITFEKTVPNIVRSSLRRLHQNLGHPRAEDLCRHLRLAGCEPSVIKAVKGMKRETCQATKHAQLARPTTLPRLLDFNSCVGVDLFYAHDALDKRHTFLTVVAWATTYQVVVRLECEDGPSVEKAFNTCWLTPFGPPTTVSLDLDGKVQAGLGRLCDWHNIRMKDVAAQAKWQGGVTEPQIGWFKGIWERVVHELNVTEEEAEIELCDPDAGGVVTWDLTEDSKFQREMNDYVEDCFTGQEQRRRSTRSGLTAPEHLRSSGPEEVGEFLTMKGAEEEDGGEQTMGDDYRDALKRKDDGLDHLSDYGSDMSDGGVVLDGEGDHEMAERGEDTLEHVLPLRRLRKKTRKDQIARDPDEVMLTNKALTQRGHAKRQEKELRWNEIPEHARKLFKDAEKVQWDEHLSYDALEPLSLEESKRVRDSVPASRTLPCRWAYRDKNWAARQASGGEQEPAWRCKSRLVIGGHRDPDLGVEALDTDAPTLSRPGFACLMQLLANGLEAEDPWTAAAGDIQCAFLTGGYLTRGEDLYLHQPATGFPGLLPGQLVRIKKNIFGLATSPHEWWKDLQQGMLSAEIQYLGETYGFEQCPLDPCIFMLRRRDNEKFTGKPLGYVGSHVDDLLVIAGKVVNKLIQAALSKTFPIDKWEEDHLDYVGTEIICGQGEVLVTQRKYAGTRLLTVDIPKGLDEEDLAGPEQIADNQSLIGALSWLASQTRPDLTCSVSLAQQLQRRPTIGDLKFTNQISMRALAYKEEGLRYRPLPATFGVVVYHDAAWANALDDECEEDYFRLTEEDREAGLMREGPFGSRKECKAKRQNSKVASQIGALVLFADLESVKGGIGNFSIADWRSRAGQRVCRSTSGAETQASVEGVEGAQYMRSSIETLVEGELVKVESSKAPLLCLSDCGSLYDHLHKQGIPRVPTDRRLAIDLAALRQSLKREQWGSKLPIGWVPSGLQFGDILTKPGDPKQWWDSQKGQLSVPIDLSENGRASVFHEEKRTSVEHKVNTCSDHRDDSTFGNLRTAVLCKKDSTYGSRL
ncbi:RE2 [Symbiodinium sp. CCMP2592]|nr:RE2 [Symbiodinium sp. CCMP2592]